MRLYIKEALLFNLSLVLHSVAGNTSPRRSLQLTRDLMAPHIPRTLDLDGIPLISGSSENESTDSVSDTLSTGFIGGTGQAGNMFDVKALADVTIKGMDIHMLPGFANVTVYYKVGRYEGFQTEIFEEYWTVIYSEEVEGAGNGQPTSLDSTKFTPVSIATNGWRSFYVTLDSPNLRYSVGNGSNTLATSDDMLELYEGTGTAYPAFSNYIDGRLWNGNLHYTHGLESPVDDSVGDILDEHAVIETTYAGGSGQAGNMFDIYVFGSDTNEHSHIVVAHMDIHTLWEEEEYRLWGKSGSYMGYENTASKWTVMGAGVVKGKGVGVASPLPLDTFTPVQIQVGSTYSFYISLSRANLRYTVGSGEGSVVTSNSDLQILEGIGVALPHFIGGHVNSRIWNGALYYNKISLTNTPSLAPTEFPSSTPSIMSSDTPSGSPSTSSNHCEEFVIEEFGNKKNENIAYVDFDYELVAKKRIDFSQSLPFLEFDMFRDVVNGIQGCDEGHVHHSLRGSRNLHEIALYGGSPDPIDEFDGENDCGISSVGEGESCFAMKGHLTLYVNDDHTLDIEEIVMEARAYIKDHMIAGHYSFPDLGIVALSFIGTREIVENDAELSLNIGDTPKTLEDEGSNEITPYGGLFIAFGVAAAVAAFATVFVLIRRKKSSKDEPEREEWEESSEGEFSTSRVSFDNEGGRTRAIRFHEVNGQIIGQFESGTFDEIDVFSQPDPASPSKRLSTMDVHKCNSASCKQCKYNSPDQTTFVSAPAQR